MLTILKNKYKIYISNLVFIPGAVVQLVRISACHAGGRGFESRPHRKILFLIKFIINFYNYNFYKVIIINNKMYIFLNY